MVRDVRARLYEVESGIARPGVENIPVKVDVETLYILEQKSDKKSITANENIQVHNLEQNRIGGSDRHDFAMQTPIPITTIKVSNRPIGTQVDSTIERSTVAAQTTDSLHRPIKERQRLASTSPLEEGEVSKVIRTTTTTTRYEVKRRHSSHHSSGDDEDGAGSTVIYIDDKENFQMNPQPIPGPQIENIAEHHTSINQVASRVIIDQGNEINRTNVRRQIDRQEQEDHENRSLEVYEVHTRGACKCLVVSYEEKTQYGAETRFEKQLKRIERTYTNEELKSTELHVIVTVPDNDYQLVRRDYGAHVNVADEDEMQDKTIPPTVTIHYYSKEGHRVRTEHERRLEHLPLFIRCEIEYELNHYGTFDV